MLHLLDADGLVQFKQPTAERRPARWLIGIAAAGAEYTVCRRIEDEVGIEVYLPFEVKRRRLGRNRVVDVVVPFFRTYFFVPASISDADYHGVRFTHGVRDFLQIDRKPCVIRDSELDRVRLQEQDAEQRRRRRFFQSGEGPQFMVGEEVKVTIGFSELDATVHEISRKRIRVKLAAGTLFGRDVVEVDLGHISQA